LSRADLDTTVEALDLGPKVAVGVVAGYPNEDTFRAALLTSARNALPGRDLPPENET
jgi:hypothetical protein